MSQCKKHPISQCRALHSVSRNVTCQCQCYARVTHVIQCHISHVTDSHMCQCHTSFSITCHCHTSVLQNVTYQSRSMSLSHRSLSVNLMSPTHNVTECNITQCHHSTSPSVTQSQIALTITYSMSLSYSIIHQCHTLHIMSHNITQCHTSLSQCQCPTVLYIPHCHTVSHIVTPRCHTVSQHCHTVSFSSYIIQCHSVTQCHIVHTLFIVTMSHTIVKCHTYHSISRVTQCHTRHSMSSNVTVSHSVTITHHTVSWFPAPLLLVFSQDWVAGLLGSNGSSSVLWRLPFGSVHGCPELNLCWGLVSGGSTRLLAHMELKRPCITKGTLERQLPATALTQ